MSDTHLLMDITFNNTTLRNLGHLNVVLGKNGVGKSELLRALDTFLEANPSQYLAKYISPERGGELAYHPSVEANLRSHNAWGSGARRKNRVSEFRNMSFSEYRNLELLVLRKKEVDPSAPEFDLTLDKINALLNHVKIVRRDNADLVIYSKQFAEAQKTKSMSSGESELVTLAIEILAFCERSEHIDHINKKKFLLIDEPDVHLHPDLQVRLVKLIAEATKDKDITAVIATHSTPILTALTARTDRVRIYGKIRADD